MTGRCHSSDSLKIMEKKTVHKIGQTGHAKFIRLRPAWLNPVTKAYHFGSSMVIKGLKQIILKLMIIFKINDKNHFLNDK